VSQLIQALAAELERPRELSARVVNYINGHYGFDDDAIGLFLLDELPKLEDYEVDLILSPVFTPKLADQALFAELLGQQSVPRTEWPALVQQLVARPTRGNFITPDGQTHSIKLREVTIERYVHRLRLEGTISASVFKLIDNVPATEDRPMLKAIARREAWEADDVRGILVRYLEAVLGRSSYSLADTVELLNLVENRKPASLSDLMARIPAWQEALRQQIEVSGKPFFHEDIRAMHGGGRDQRQEGDTRMSAKEEEFAFLGRLQKLLAEP
jgi:hypothetical protein